MAIGNLRDNWGRSLGSRCLWLAVGDLRHSGGGRGGGARAAAVVLCVDVDLVTLLALRLIVEVVKATRVALIPDGGTIESQGTVSADGEARGLEGTCLDGLVKLESEYCLSSQFHVCIITSSYWWLDAI